MKVVVFGGCGDMGKCATRDLASNTDVEKLVIADYNIKKANELAKELNSTPFSSGKVGQEERISAEFVDATKTEQVINLMKGNDVCLSCIGPFYKFEEKMVRCAISAKVNYVSICDDYDAVERILPLDKEAKEAGILVLTGMGWTPGLSNVLAKKGMNSLEKSEKINISWAGDAFDSEGLAVIKHTYHIFTGKVKTYKEGKLVEIEAGTEREIVEFPPPIGKVPMLHVGHPEPVTFAHFFPQLKEVTLKGGLKPIFLNSLAVFIAKKGLTNTVEKKDKISKLTFDILKLTTPLKSIKKAVSAVRVDVLGERNGEKEKISFFAVDKMERLTGLPASVGTWLIGTGKIIEKGVLAPEVSVNPDNLLPELEKRGIAITTYIQKV